jgi:hypothetical protein
MTRRPRRNHTHAFKAKIALAAIKGARTLAQPVEQVDIHLDRGTDPIRVWPRACCPRSASPCSAPVFGTKLGSRNKIETVFGFDETKFRLPF